MSNILRAIAVDDEPLALSVVDIFCKKHSSLELVAQFSSGMEALKYVDNNQVDLVFLDINMPHITGVELAKMLNKRVMVIFTTAYQNYAVEGFELQAVDYLMKPFSYDRFCQSVARAEELCRLRSREADGTASGVSTEVPNIVVKAGSSLVKIEIDNIVVVEGLKDYVKIVTTDKRYVVKSTMKNIEQSLGGYGFIRVQKSYVVNVRRVTSYHGDMITMLTGEKVPVGLQYKANFMELFSAQRL